MTDIICDRCGETGIRWMGSFNNLTHTECPHCGGRNCQQPPLTEEDEADVRETINSGDWQ